jgi:hypothetical protein
MLFKFLGETIMSDWRVNVPDECEWTWDTDVESWLMGNPEDGAGVFYEEKNHGRNQEGWYFGTVVHGAIMDVAIGPYPDRDAAMVAAYQSFIKRSWEI